MRELKWSLLDGPVGQLSLAGLVLDERDMVLNYELRALADVRSFRDLLARRVSVRLSELIEEAATNPRQVLEVVGTYVESTHHGYATFGHHRFDALRACAEILRPIEQVLCNTSGLSWWWESLGPQQFITETAEHRRVDVPTLASAYAVGWWVAPMTSRTLHTTRGPVAGAGSVGAICAEDLAVDEPAVVPFTPPEGAVLELSEPREWVRLVENFPKRVPDHGDDWQGMTGQTGDWFVPDWSKVAAHYVGVHLPMATYLAGAYRPFPVDGGYTILAGWDPDATVWFDVDYG